ncbi:MAG TPA: hypothetical protein VIL99_12000 [Ignavibacteria bacterium]
MKIIEFSHTPLKCKKLRFFILLLIFQFILVFSSKAQSINEFGKFPVNYSEDNPILTSTLLEKLNWESIKKFCDTTKGHYVHTYNYDSLVEYAYTEQGYINHFTIISYKGSVLQFDTDIEKSSKPSRISYFDKNVWMSYVKNVLPNLPDSLQLKLDESKTILKSYYKLLGVNTRDEYGWICEYSTVGLATDRREAVIDLIKQERIDLLKKIIGYPNVQTQLYAANALIYLDYDMKIEIATYQKELEQDKVQLDSLKKIENIRNSLIESVERNIKDTKKIIEYVESKLLSKDDWNKIYKLRDSHQIVMICGNSGSYKIYESTTFDLLSDDAIAEIPKNYEELRNLGYLR